MSASTASSWLPRPTRGRNGSPLFAAGVDWPQEEGKRLSLSFHYRTADDVAAAESALRAVAEQALAEGLRPRWGRRVLEIRPPIDGDKGTAVRQLLAEAAAFAARCTQGTIRPTSTRSAASTAWSSPCESPSARTKAPDELGPAADLVVDGPEGLAAVLARL